MKILPLKCVNLTWNDPSIITSAEKKTWGKKAVNSESHLKQRRLRRIHCNKKHASALCVRDDVQPLIRSNGKQKFNYSANISLFQITLHVAYVHAFVNPILFLVLHRGLRQAALDLCCGCCTQWSTWLLNTTSSNSSSTGIAAAPTLLPPPPQPPVTSLGDISLLKPPLPPANTKPQLVNRTYM